MNRRSLALILAVAGGMCLLAIMVQSWWQSSASSQLARPARPQPASVAMPASATAIQITLGLRDEEPTRWDGEVQLSEGKLLDLRVAFGGAQAKVEDHRFIARSALDEQMKKQGVQSPQLQLLVDAPATATIRVKTEQGEFQFRLGDLSAEKSLELLDGRVAVQRAGRWSAANRSPDRRRLPSTNPRT
jgi:flagellar basal body-associated protein FliL